MPGVRRIERLDQTDGEELYGAVEGQNERI